MNEERATRLHTVIAAGCALADDRTASVAPELYDLLKGNGDLIKAGTRINWYGTLKRAAVDLWDTEQNTPDNAPTLWEDIAYKMGERIIPETITAGTAFAMYEKGWWRDTLYVSLLDANVWTPEDYPQGWMMND